MDGAIAIQNVNDWLWQKQLRYYTSDGDTVMRMCDAKFSYTFEYQGNAPKLVHTPLTDKCYLTLTQVNFIPSRFSLMDSLIL